MNKSPIQLQFEAMANDIMVKCLTDLNNHKVTSNRIKIMQDAHAEMKVLKAFYQEFITEPVTDATFYEAMNVQISL